MSSRRSGEIPPGGDRTHPAAPGRPAADRAALDPGLTLAVRYRLEQGLLPRPLAAAEIWAGLRAAMAWQARQGGQEQ
jgi:hypothetical protein